MALTTLENAKKQLNIAASDTDNDVEIQSVIDSVTAPIENVVGPVEQREVVEVHQGGEFSIVLLQAPVLSITSMVAVHTDGVSVDVSDVDLSEVTGVVRRKDRGLFRNALRVTYQAGRSATPSNIEFAARIIVDHMWRTQRGQLTALAGEELQFEPQGFLIPRRAMELLIPHSRSPMVAG